MREGRGEHRARLAARLRKFLGVDDVLLTPSGRASLYAILKAADRPRVVLPAYTCNAVTEAAILAGKDITYADAEADGFNVDVDALAPLLGPDSVFVATHQFGIPCAIEKFVEICAKAGTLVVEDAAASLGTRVAGRLTGTFGDAAFFSFDTTKLVGIPLKGGAVVARDPALMGKIRAAHEAETEPMPAYVKARTLALGAALASLKGPRAYRAFHALRFERTGTYTAEAPLGPVFRGPFYRYDLAEWQALLAAEQMERVEETVARRRTIYAEYERRLRGMRSFQTPPPDPAREWAPIRFPIRVRGDKLAFYRAATALGVDFAFSFTFIEAPASFARAHALAGSVLDLPFYPDLTRGEIDAVVDALETLERRSC